MKKSWSVITALLLSLFIVQIVSAEEAKLPVITVDYQGEKLTFEGSPVLENGSVLVPFRGVFEAFGLKVSWEPSSKRVTGSNEVVKIEMNIGKKTVSVNGENKDLEVEPKLVEGNTMVPLRFVSESMGKVVTWDPSTDTVHIKNRMDVRPTVSNYGGDSYYPTNHSNQYGKINPYMFEKDGYLYLLWSADEKGTSYVNFYCSVADLNNGRWIYQNQRFRYVKKEVTSFQYFFYENSVYWRTPDGVVKSSFDRGTVTQDVYVAKKKITKEKEMMAIARYDDGKTGLILGEKNYVYLYTEEEPNGMFGIEDLNNVLMEFSGTNAHYLINRNSKIIQIIFNNKVKQLNYESGDILYDDKGQDKIQQLKGTTFTQPIYYYDKLYYLYQDGQDRRIKLGTIDDDIHNEELGFINFVPPSNLSEYKLTMNDNELHLWKNTDFKRLPAIDFTNIIK